MEIAIIKNQLMQLSTPESESMNNFMNMYDLSGLTIGFRT